jgi:hypothetical protein
MIKYQVYTPKKGEEIKYMENYKYNINDKVYLSGYGIRFMPGIRELLVLDRDNVEVSSGGRKNTYRVEGNEYGSGWYYEEDLFASKKELKEKMIEVINNIN